MNIYIRAILQLTNGYSISITEKKKQYIWINNHFVNLDLCLSLALKAEKEFSFRILYFNERHFMPSNNLCY